jgi:ubiquinone/menaquinone biosynthesis C-methylase UbiE
MNCDLIAPFYRWLEYMAFGCELERRRFEYLDQLQDFRHVLILGDGDGRFLQRFLQVNQTAKVDSIDLSEGMLRLAQDRADNSRVTFHHGDARTIPLARGYDLIVTHFFLDCFEQSEVEPLIRRVAGHADKNACWVTSEFHQPESGWRAVRARVWLALLYAAFRVATGLRTTKLMNHRPTLQQCGFRLERSSSASGDLLVSEFWRHDSSADATCSAQHPAENSSESSPRPASKHRSGPIGTAYS